MSVNRSKQGGYTLLELLIVTFVVATAVVGIFGLFVLSLRTAQEGERRVVAVALANERMEMIRNLPYLEVGTAGGVPTGPLAQEETIVRNDQTYTILTDIRYVDDAYDGQQAGVVEEEERVTICHKAGTPNEKTLIVSARALGAHLAHGDITGACGSGGEGTPDGDVYNADYKQVRVEVTWPSPNGPRTLRLITYVVPFGIEGGELAGTLDFQALDASGQGVEDAAITLTNETVDPTINIATQTNDEGRVVLPGLPESAESYELVLSKPGYTSEQTYDLTPSFIPDTDHSHLSMVVQEVTDKTFNIDQESSLSITTQDEAGQKLAGIPYSLSGTKSMGTDGAGDTVLVVDLTEQTDGAGAASHDGLVWDTYDFSIDGLAAGYDIKESSLLLPLTVAAGMALDMVVTLVDHTDISLQVTVVTPVGLPVDNAILRLQGNGVDETLGTGVYGQILYVDLPVNGDYTLDINAPGFVVDTTPVNVEDTARIIVELTPL